MSALNSDAHAGNVLVVDDDPDQRWIVENYLGEKGFTVFAAEDGEKMRTLLREQRIDLVIMDVGLPGEDGFSLTKYVRTEYDIGIIMVTAANELVDRVLGLEFGADDYLAKPFELRELFARIKSILRRNSSSKSSDTSNDAASGIYRFEDFCFDTKQFLVSKNDDPCFMEPKCIDLLKFLVENADRVVSKDDVLEAVWPGRVVTESTVSTLVKQLRRALDDNGKDQRLIRTVHGRGFQFVGVLKQA